MSPAHRDPSTLSNYNEIKTTNLHLDVAVCFDAKNVSGQVVLDLTAVKDGVSEVVLDTRYLNIKGTSLVGSDGRNESLQYTIEDHRPPFGSALRIRLPQPLRSRSVIKICVMYETNRSCTALQWLEPSQTAGKVYPYMFSQCQAIHARSLVPCQDTPALKLRYTASVTTPKTMTALMSALRVESTEHPDGKRRIFRFQQTIGIPSYLIAIAVGNLAEREMSPRSSVWSEPEVVDAAAWEFGKDTDQFIGIAESMLTPYEWGRFDLLILPPSFPYGGMENPCLTFVTPTLLAGDRSLVDVVAHELAHSWSGNLVTTVDWTHFWLNEGWTMFIERKIIGRLHGEPSRQLSAIMGWKKLEADIQLFGTDNPLTALRPKMDGINPDDSFSSVPYEKGFNLLYHLEQILGGPSVFEPYMCEYFRRFAHQSVSTEDWKAFLYEYMREHHGGEKIAVLDKVDWEVWFDSPGMPPVFCDFDRTLAEACDHLAARWDAARSSSENRNFSGADVADFRPEQMMVFLDRCRDLQPFPHELLELMDRVYDLSSARNSEIRFSWLMLCLKAEWEAVFPQVVQFVLEQGRMKFVRPLYRDLAKCKSGYELAAATFAEHEKFYHPIAAAQIAKDINKTRKPLVSC